MKRGFYLYFAVAFILIIILYEIWPVPFWFISREVILPAAQMSSDAAKIIASPFSVLANFNSLEKDNKKLTQENNQLRAELAKLSEQSHICSSATAEILSSSSYENAKVAKVVGRTPWGYRESLVVNAGQNDSIREGAAVLSNGYLVGRVKKVHSSQSEIELISSHVSLIPAILEKSRESGLIQGKLEGLSMIEVPTNANIEANEKVLTSGLGGDLPSGLLIGETLPIVGVKKGPFQTLKISSPINFSSIEFVSILK